MKTRLNPLHWAYVLARRLGIVEVTWLLHVPSSQAITIPTPYGYEIRSVQLGEMAELVRAGKIDSDAGHCRALENPDRCLVAAFHQSKIVAYAWFAKRAIPGADVCNGSQHLGTSVDLPDGTALIYNTWTDQAHGEQRLISSLIRWTIRNHIAGTWSIAAMIDWMDDGSNHVFEELGMNRLGRVVRIGFGPLQFSLLPAAAQNVGIRVGDDARGIKLAT